MSAILRARIRPIELAAPALFALLCVGCPEADDDDTETYVSSRSYQGHENDIDINLFVNAWPATTGTRLDDCQTCHKGFTFTWDEDEEQQTVFMNACDYCHLIEHPRDPGFDQVQPTTFDETLNPFGADYAGAGRDADALPAIAGQDSDGDGFDNEEEIAALRYPGDEASQPGQDVAPMVEFSWADLGAMPQHEEFLLANSHRQQYDFYANYGGVRLVDLLAEVGVDVSAADFQGITVIAPDGYLKDFDASAVRDQYPDALFFAGLDTATLGTDCGFVQYPDTLPSGLVDGGTVPGDQWLMLATSRDDLPMEPSNLDVTSGKLNGEGPIRLIAPQWTPGPPDRGANYSPSGCEDGHDFDDSADHNAGDMVRGVIAVRVNPLPAGYEDFDYRYGGWAYIDSQSLLVYGTGVEAR